MKRLVCFSAILFCGSLFAVDAPKRGAKTAAPKVKQTQPATDSRGLPVGATQVSEGVYRYVAADGKAWLYHKTPFGWSKALESETDVRRTDAKGEKIVSPFGHRDPADAPAVEDAIKAIDAGDEVKFERKSPFGVSSWTKKKSELNEQERKAYERSRDGQK